MSTRSVRPIPSAPNLRNPISLSRLEAQVITAIREDGPLSRTDLARVTGYSRAAITVAASSLIKSGILEETGEGESQGGRRPRVLALRCDLRYVVGVDIGATSIDLALADMRGMVLERGGAAADVGDGPEPVLGRVNELIGELLDRRGILPEQVYAVGVGVPAPVDFATGAVCAPPMPEWEGYPVHEFFWTMLPSATVVVDNDANVMALGELRALARGVDNLIFVKIGTGIGAGIICNGAVYRGTKGYAGEVGHFHLDRNGPVCPRCGNVGCLEAMAAGPAIANRAMEAAQNGVSRILARQMEARGGVLTAEDVSEAAATGDRVSIEIIQDSGRMIGEALAGMVNFFNPGLVLIGGGVSLAGPKLLSAIRQEVLRRAHPRSTEDLRIEFSRLGPDVGVIGAIWLALERVMAPDSAVKLVEAISRERR